MLAPDMAALMESAGKPSLNFLIPLVVLLDFGSVLRWFSCTRRSARGSAPVRPPQ